VNSVSSQRQADLRIGRGLAALLLALVGLSTFAARADAGSREFYGVVPEGLSTLSGKDFKKMKQGRVGALRFQLSWGNVEGTRDNYNWSTYDSLLTSLAQRGIRPAPFIYGTPGWMNANPAAVPRTAAEKVELEEFLGDVAERYGRGGTFWQINPSLPAKPVLSWQFLNEINSSKFYAPKPKPSQYAGLLKLAHRAITSEDPKAKIILAGMFGTPQKGMTAWRYLRGLYKVRKVEAAFDGIALHPYSPNLRGISYQLDKARKELRRAGDSKTPTYITEIGWGSGKGGNELLKGKRGQAKMVTSSVKLLKKHRDWKVKQYFYYSFKDPAKSFGDPCIWCPTAGLFTKTLRAKPSWRAFVKLTGGKP